MGLGVVEACDYLLPGQTRAAIHKGCQQQWFEHLLGPQTGWASQGGPNVVGVSKELPAAESQSLAQLPEEKGSPPKTGHRRMRVSGDQVVTPWQG